MTRNSRDAHGHDRLGIPAAAPRNTPPARCATGLSVGVSAIPPLAEALGPPNRQSLSSAELPARELAKESVLGLVAGRATPAQEVHCTIRSVPRPAFARCRE